MLLVIIISLRILHPEVPHSFQSWIYPREQDVAGRDVPGAGGEAETERLLPHPLQGGGGRHGRGEHRQAGHHEGRHAGDDQVRQ